MIKVVEVSLLVWSHFMLTWNQTRFCCFLFLLLSCDEEIADCRDVRIDQASKVDKSYSRILFFFVFLVCLEDGAKHSVWWD